MPSRNYSRKKRTNIWILLRDAHDISRGTWNSINKSQSSQNHRHSNHFRGCKRINEPPIDGIAKPFSLHTALTSHILIFFGQIDISKVTMILPTVWDLSYDIVAIQCRFVLCFDFVLGVFSLFFFHVESQFLATRFLATLGLDMFLCLWRIVKLIACFYDPDPWAFWFLVFDKDSDSAA